MDDTLPSQLPELAVPAPGAQLFAVVFLPLREPRFTHPVLVVVLVHPSVVGLPQRCLLSVFDQRSRRVGATLLTEVAARIVRVRRQHTQVFRISEEDLYPNMAVPSFLSREINILDRQRVHVD